MKLWPWITGFTAASAATLLYGALVEANKLVLEEHTLELPNWPERLNGYRLAVIADLHLRDCYTVDHAQRAVALALGQAPDMIAILGDFVGYWKEGSEDLLREALDPLQMMEGRVVAIPGNHDYWSGNASRLEPVLSGLDIHLLRNQVWRHDGITWVGVDSTNALKADPFTPMSKALLDDDPIVVLWHEPDSVDWLPSGASLMMAGHSHGGQFTFPWGWTPMHTKNGRKYVKGYFPDAPTPLFVSRGLGTTGPPSRLGNTPEVALLTLRSLAP